jgi:hypothetical protein
MTSIDPSIFPLLFPSCTTYQYVEDWREHVLSANFGGDAEVSVVSITQLKYKADQEHQKTVIKLKVVPRDGDSHSTQYTWVTTERGAELDNIDRSFSSPSSPATQCTSCAVIKLVSASDIPAIDRVVTPATIGRPTFKQTKTNPHHPLHNHAQPPHEPGTTCCPPEHYSQLLILVRFTQI